MDLDHEKYRDLVKLTKKAIYQHIYSMNLEENNKLPREEKLAEIIGVSRITVRSALNELAAEGIIFRKQGKGTFINKSAVQKKVVFNPVEDLRKVIEKSGFEVNVETVKIQIRNATAKEAEKLRINTDNKVIVIERLFYADDNPAIYCIDRIPKKLCSDKIDFNDLEMPLYDFFKIKLGKEITWDIVELLTATNEEVEALAKYFNHKGVKAFLNCDIVNFYDENYPVCYVNEYIDTDLIRYNLIRQKNLY